MVNTRLLIPAILVAALISCQKSEQIFPEQAGIVNVSMTVHTDDAKTSIDGENAIRWGTGEYVMMYYNDGSDHMVKSNASSADSFNGHTSATFDFTVSPKASASYTIGGLYPASAVSSYGAGSATATIPSIQNATSASYDPAAFIMAIRPEVVSEIPSCWTAWFRKAAALNKITLKGVQGVVKAVEIKAEGKNLCGDGVIDLNTGKPSGYDNTGDIVKVKYASPLPAGDMTIWFTSWNSVIASGESLTITAFTENGYFTRTITAHAEGISFKESKLNTLVVDFSEVTFTSYSLKDFAKAFVTCLDVWENTVGTVDADGTHNGATAWTGVHLLPIVNNSSGRYKNAGNQYDAKYSPFWEADLGGRVYSSNQCWEIAIRGLMNLCTTEGDAFLPGMTDRNKAYTLSDNGSMSDAVPSYLSNNAWGDYPWYEYDKEVKNGGVPVTEVDVNFLIKCGSWHIVRGLIANSGNTPLGKIGNYQEFGTSSSTLKLSNYVGYISPMRELLIAARIYKCILDNGIESNVYTALSGVKFDYGLYSKAAPAPVSSTTKAGIWVNYSSMNSVDLQSLANKGISDIFLHEYAFSKLGKSSVDTFLANAHQYGMKVHIWLQCFWWNDSIKWRVPVIDRNGATPASYNQSLFNEVIARAQDYLDSDIDGIHLDYVRFGGTGAKHSFPQDGITSTGAITEFCRQMSVAAKTKKANVILSAALMGETGAQTAYGQEPSEMGQYIDILLPMAYISSYGYSDAGNVNVANWFKARCGGAEVWHGISTYDSNSIGLSSDAIYHDASNIMSNSNADGVAFFRYGLGTIPDVNNLFAHE